MNSEPENLHVIQSAVDYVAGRLAPALASEIELHLRGCAECAAYFAFVGEIERDVLSTGARHLRPERIVALGEMPDTAPSQAERRHLEICDACRDELGWAASAPPLHIVDSALDEEEMGEPAAQVVPARLSNTTAAGGPPPPRPWWSRLVPRPWAWTALGTAIVVVAVLLTRPPQAPDGKIPEVRLDPLPVSQVTRDAATRPELAAAWASAMAAYGSADYAQAARAFERVIALSPDDAAGFLYLGSALLLRGRAGDAVPPLRQSAALARSSRLVEESRWHLAHAHLLLHDAAAARSELQTLIDANSDRRSEAEALVREIDRSR